MIAVIRDRGRIIGGFDMTNRTCSVADCTTDMSGKYLRKGYCERHHYHWRKYGTPTPSDELRASVRAKSTPLPVVNVCVHCGESFEAASRRKKYCSRFCITWRKYLGAGGSKYCYDCGDPMVVSRTSKPGLGRCRDCSKHGAGGFDRGCRCDVCVDGKRAGNRRYKAKVLAEHGVNPSTLYRRSYFERTGVRYAKTKKDWIDPKVRRRLYERDDWLCHLCNEPVDRSAHFNDDFAPSLDHLKPRSKGGSDDPGNLRTSHRVCNSTRRDDELDALEVA